jgi:hypothetical protein
MAAIILPSRQFAQPRSFAPLDRANTQYRELRALVLPGHGGEMVMGRPLSLLNSVTVTANPSGRGFTAPTGSNKVVIPGVSGLIFTSTSECTVFLIRQSADTTARASSLFGYDNGSGDRVQSHAPYIDGNLYWDCGSTDGTHRISTSYTKSTNPEALVFVAGSTKGREVWRNGAKIAGNTGINGTFTAASVADVSVLGAASGSGLGSDSETVYLFGVVARAWSDGEILQWTANPYGMFQSPRKWWLPAVAGAGGGAARPVVFVCT